MRRRRDEVYQTVVVVNTNSLLGWVFTTRSIPVFIILGIEPVTCVIISISITVCGGVCGAEEVGEVVSECEGDGDTDSGDG